MAIGDFRHVVMFQKPTTVPDGDGGFVDTYADLPPKWRVDIRPATVRDMERQTAATIVATATHVIHGRHRADVTVDARMLFKARTFRIVGVANPKERDRDLFLFAVETV